MGYYVITYRAIVDGAEAAIGTQGATPIYEPNVLKRKVEKHFRNEYL